jgi:site-specific DNA-methyltransferase (adenine-specific)
MCIRYSGIPEGSKVYDPFNGTGTTVLAAIRNGMYGVGTDIDADYLSFSKQRIENMLVVDKSKNLLSTLFEYGN